MEMHNLRKGAVCFNSTNEVFVPNSIERKPFVASVWVEDLCSFRLASQVLQVLGSLTENRVYDSGGGWGHTQLLIIETRCSIQEFNKPKYLHETTRNTERRISICLDSCRLEMGPETKAATYIYNRL